MSRYIDADALKEKIDSMWNGRPLSFLGARILVTIDDAPSIDIVRCRECKYRNRCSTMIVFGDPERITDAFPIEYCSYGEREGE